MHATILIIDDEQFIVALLAEVLQAEGYAALRAYNGADGLALATRARPALIITDNMMPKLTGTELAARLHTDPLVPGIAIILMSAIRMPPPPGCAAFMAKPFDLGAMLSVVATTLATRCGAGGPGVLYS